MAFFWFSKHDGAHVDHLFLEHCGQVPVLPHPSDEVQRRDQPRAVLLHCGDVVGIYVGTVFDRVDARLGCEQDALRAVRVRRHLAAQAVRIGH